MKTVLLHGALTAMLIAPGLAAAVPSAGARPAAHAVPLGGARGAYRAPRVGLRGSPGFGRLGVSLGSTGLRPPSASGPRLYRYGETRPQGPVVRHAPGAPVGGAAVSRTALAGVGLGHPDPLRDGPVVRSFGPGGGRSFLWNVRGDRRGEAGFAFRGHEFFHRPGGFYRWPEGYGGWARGYWGEGDLLPSAFLASDYAIDDWQDSGLGSPDEGFGWVRVGPDALLTNLSDGRVLDHVPGVYD